MESPICPPDCCLADTSTCRAQAHEQLLGFCPCALAVGGLEDIGSPGCVPQKHPESTPGPNGTDCVQAAVRSCLESILGEASRKTEVELFVFLSALHCWALLGSGD